MESLESHELVDKTHAGSSIIEIIRRNYHLVILLAVIGGYVWVASHHLASSPMPDSGDEAMTLQVSYEMLHRGQLSLPMYRYLGGNTENAWHSFTPVFFLILSGFLKVFGWGLVQGRAVNLITAAVRLVLLNAAAP